LVITNRMPNNRPIILFYMSLIVFLVRARTSKSELLGNAIRKRVALINSLPLSESSPKSGKDKFLRNSPIARRTADWVLLGNKRHSFHPVAKSVAVRVLSWQGSCIISGVKSISWNRSRIETPFSEKWVQPF
jgi:hypothetical protein